MVIAIMQNIAPSMKKKEFIKHSIVIFLVLSIVYIALFSVIQFNAKAVEKNALQRNENRIIELEKNMIGQNLENVISDLLFLTDSFALNDFAETETAYQNLAREWQILSDKKKIYDQIRYIDTAGNETIRVNYTQQGAYIVPETALQNKSDRYYFTESIGLKKGQIYISKLDLNIENNKIEEPIKPMIRFATPVFAQDGTLKGVIVLNYYAQYLLDDFKKISGTSGGEVFLLNANGYWISNSNQEKEWAFMYEDKKGISFQTEFPDEWAAMLKDAAGNIDTKNGLFTFTHMMLLSDPLLKENTIQDARIVLGEGDWIAVSFVDRNSENGILLEEDPLKFVFSLIKEQEWFFLLILLISMVSSILMVSNKAAKAEIRYFSEYDAMTNVLNRRAGFVKLSEACQKTMKNRSKMSLCFIDINGLKDVNDVLGHEKGDELILTVVAGIKNCVRESDFIIRLGGDEFLVSFLNADEDEAEQIWQRIRAGYEQINADGSRPYLISVSHGIQEFICNKALDIIDDTVNAADEKMYQEKREIKKNLTVIR